jgi:hypothetical protein
MDNCSICLESIESASKNCVATKCGHVFHFSCLKPCITKCPICRLSLRDDEPPPTDPVIYCHICTLLHPPPICYVLVAPSLQLKVYHVTAFLSVVNYAIMYVTIALQTFSLIKEDPSSVLTRLSHCAFVMFWITNVAIPTTSRKRIILSMLPVMHYFMFKDQFAHVLLLLMFK